MADTTQLIFKPELGTPVGTYFVYTQADSGGNAVFKIAIDDLHKFLVSTAAANNADVTFADTYAVNLGTGDDLSLYHNGSSSFIDNKTGSFSIRNLSDGDALTVRAQSGGIITQVTCRPDANAIRMRGGMVTLEQKTVTLNNAEIHVTAIPIGYPGQIYLENTAGGSENGALFNCNFIAGTVQRSQGNNATWDNTKDNASTINVYNGVTYLEIQNNRGGPRTLTYGFLTAKQIT